MLLRNKMVIINIITLNFVLKTKCVFETSNKQLKCEKYETEIINAT